MHSTLFTFIACINSYALSRVDMESQWCQPVSREVIVKLYDLVFIFEHFQTFEIMCIKTINFYLDVSSFCLWCHNVDCFITNEIYASADGSLWSWGWNEHGMCGNGKTENIMIPQKITTLDERLFLIGCGAGHSLAVTNRKHPNTSENQYTGWEANADWLWSWSLNGCYK